MMGPFCNFAKIRSNSNIKNKLKQLMSNSKISAAAFADTKPHYDLLDGLRGVAALMVIFYHVFEAFATSPIDQRFNHGYLAVDFFFILSGFVIGYAYDDRWKTMTTKDFIKRRLIRLHPMVVLGAVLGVIAFCIQGCEKWDGTQVSISMVMLALLINLFLIPAVPGSGPEIRGNGEMYPLNGPSWSLFFEYIGNIMYALFIRRMSTKALTALVVLAGIGLASFAIFNFSGAGHLGVGWTMEEYNRYASTFISF
jgi:acyltransferase